MDDNRSYRSPGTDRDEARESLRRTAQLLDTQFEIFGIRVGWDAILGLIPGFGDLATNLASFYILVQASRLGAPPSVIVRMGLNLAVDNLLDAVPFFGNFFDIFWRANTKNVVLLDRYLVDPRKTSSRSRWVVLATIAGVLLLMFATAALAVYLAAVVLGMFVSAGSF